MLFLRLEQLVAGMTSASPKSIGGMELFKMSGRSCIETSRNLTKHGAREQQPEATQGGQMKHRVPNGIFLGEKVVGQVRASVPRAALWGERARKRGFLT